MFQHWIEAFCHRSAFDNAALATALPHCFPCFHRSQRLLNPSAVVNQDNVQETIVESGLYSADDICTKAYADACEKAGVS